MSIVRDFFGSATIGPAAHAVDVGAGTNLYPALAMLPFCTKLDLVEFSVANLGWLRRQISGYDDHWDDFWRIYAEHRAYAQLTAPRAEWARKVAVARGSVFRLPTQAWDLGTMFFVACSLSTDKAEFHRAVHCFVGSLRPSAPFATAFMADSRGYFVADRWFPAVAIGVDDVAECLASVAYDVDIRLIDIGDPLRDGYSGMIVATGLAVDQR
jgi:hypothetical protein